MACPVGFPQLSFHPYKSRRMNDLERLSLYATLAMLYCALYFVADSVPGTAKVGAVGHRDRTFGVGGYEG